MKEPPNSRYFRPPRNGQPIVWMMRWSGFGTCQTSLTPRAQTCGFSPARLNRSIATPVRWPCVPSASTVTFAITSDPGSKFESGSPSRPRPLSPLRAPTALPPSTSRFSAAGLRLLAQPTREFCQGGDVVPVVAHRRRRRDPKGRALREVVDALAVDRTVERHLLDADPLAEEPAKRARVDDGAGQRVGAHALALLEHGHRNLAEPLRGLGRILEQLAEADRACKAGRACADDQDADIDPLLRRVRGRRDVVARVEGGREICGSHAAHRLVGPGASGA